MGGGIEMLSLLTVLFFPLSFFPSFPSFSHLMNIKCGVPAMRLVSATAEGLNH